MVDNIVFDSQDVPLILDTLLKAFGIVIISIFVSIVISLYLGKKLFTSTLFPHLALNAVQKTEEGFIGVESDYGKFVGRTAIAHTVLRPSGMIEIDGDLYDAMSEIGYIDKGEKVIIKKYETGQLHVDKA